MYEFDHSHLVRKEKVMKKEMKKEEMKKEMSVVKTRALSIYSKVKPYEKYIIAAAFLVVIDKFVFKGMFSDRIQLLAKRLGENVIAVLDKAIDKLTGEPTNDK